MWWSGSDTIQYENGLKRLRALYSVGGVLKRKAYNRGMLGFGDIYGVIYARKREN